jgi:hypothetical protein
MNSQLLSQARFQFEQDLEKIKTEEPNELYLAKNAIAIIREHCLKLSILISQIDLKTKELEIYFFKELKCFFYSQLYYFQDIRVLHSYMPNGNDKSKQSFIKECQHRLHEHFLHNRSMYSYYRTNDSEYDHQYFSHIRRHDSKFDCEGISVYCEDDYSCTHDILFARVIANDRLQKYLQFELKKNNGNESELILNSSKRKRLVWTESKAALVELLYALQESKCINEGKIGIKELMQSVEYLFQGLELGDYYRTYIDLKNRTHRTKFIDSLRSNLIIRLENEDEKGNKIHKK